MLFLQLSTEDTWPSLKEEIEEMKKVLKRERGDRRVRERSTHKNSKKWIVIQTRKVVTWPE